jgi:cystathionine beta-lyase/cystathionine gamma-synthase
MSGKSDGLAGSISLSRNLPAPIKANIRSYLALNGPVLHHSYAQVLSKRMSDLHLRISAASKNALVVAKEFATRGYPVYYPGLPSYAHSAAFRKMLFERKFGHGGVVAVDMITTDAAVEFVRKMKRIEAGYSAVSLGSSHTYACAPNSSVSSGTGGPIELTPSLVRIAIGYECRPELLLEQVKGAL